MTRKYFLVGLGCMLSGKTFLGSLILKLPKDEYELAGRKKEILAEKAKIYSTMPICLKHRGKGESGKS